MDIQAILTSALDLLVVARYSIAAAYVVVFYDWIITLDQEIAFIHPARWNIVKATYLFCRYYPMAIAPFLFWGLLFDHDRYLCDHYYHALYACLIPMTLSAQFILMLRTYAFSGRKNSILAILSLSFLGLIAVIIWVMSTQLSSSPIFLFVENSGCFAISDLPDFSAAPPSDGPVSLPIASHLGLISIFTTVFDYLNMFIVVRHCVRGRSTLGPLGQSFLKQGIIVYVIMTALNTLTIGVYFSPQLLRSLKGMGPWFAYILPSVLSCRLVLMLRRKASPTVTELRLEHSHIVNEALEMITVEFGPEECHPEETSDGCVTSVSTGPRAQP